jgi:hypothetical protein
MASGSSIDVVRNRCSGGRLLFANRQGFGSAAPVRRIVLR